LAVSGASTLDITLDAPGGALGGFSYLDAPAGAAVTLTANAASMGPIAVGALGSAVASLSLKAQVATLGNVTVDGNLDLQGSMTRTLGNVSVGGNARLATAALTRLGNLGVAGSLSLVGGLPALTQAGTFQAGSMPGLSRTMQIGSQAARGSSIGAISIGSVTRTKQQSGVYTFAFATYGGTPNATVGGKRIIATRAGASFGGVTLFATATPTRPSRKR
jgi:hypothetical protein